MNPDYETQLDAEIDLQLKDLPELNAPSGLSARVMARIEQQPALPWYRQSWDAWPAGTRAVTLTILLAMFGGLCFGIWHVSQADGLLAVTRHLGATFSGLDVFWDTLRVLGESALLVAARLGTGFIVACVMLAACSYFACIGLGTMIVRYALARR